VIVEQLRKVNFSSRCSNITKASAKMRYAGDTLAIASIFLAWSGVHPGLAQTPQAAPYKYVFSAFPPKMEDIKAPPTVIPAADLETVVGTASFRVLTPGPFWYNVRYHHKTYESLDPH
jgi:hypothetical protein